MTYSHPPHVSIARVPTPLQDLPTLSAELGVTICAKRDDLTGSALSGNKVRKLEYLFADAEAQGADTIITCGGEQSNHCRATAIAAAERRLASYLLLRTEDPTRPPPTEANILLDRLVGAEIRWVSREQYRRRAELFVEVAEELRRRGRKPYVVPEGGSNALGSWGYIRAVEELVEQIGREPVTLVYAAGSGGTGAGLILGVKLLGLPWRVVGVNVCDNRDYFVRVIGEICETSIQQYALPVQFSRDEIEIVDGYVGLGYAKSRPEELALLRDVARKEGLILDPVYTGKAMFGLWSELKRGTALGKQLVFFHTGGIFGLFPKAAELAPLL